MTEQGFGMENEGLCPHCPRHCSLSEPGCIRGEEYAKEMARGEPNFEEEKPWPHRPEPRFGPEEPFDDERMHRFHEPEDWPAPPGRGPHHEPGRPEPGPHHGPGPHHEPGPHGRGPGRPPRPEPPEPEPDRDSLMGLMRRCGHYLAHRAGAVSSRERMLRLLLERGEMSQSDLVRLLELRSASVSEQLGKLEARGLVERKRSEEDRRGVTIELSESGRELAQSLPESGAGVFSALDEGEQETLKILLTKLLASWEGGELKNIAPQC